MKYEGKSLAYKLTIDSIKDMKRMPPINYIAGWHRTLVTRFKNIPNTVETVDDIKSAICDWFYGGWEPEFHSEAAYQLWENIKPINNGG